ncbi:chorismate--pyruvate lyase [Microbulbifer agarilyticus]|uniref:Probable chorismate pyruvate-lyase n=1 Tax=Microbulbifer agarilyticus TaxID=260552 RepID=A0A1Q2M953_9GAMM|nr:chorismate lyase [Microbulbifer agarilyticus]AQQ69214.1 chorismate--pyruvate lyase [Microbulbifer agarilyticus]
MYHSPFEAIGDWHPQPLESLHGQKPPEQLLPWLLHPGSLTAALKYLGEGSFRVQILNQGWQTPRPEERRALNLKDRSRALVREVLLYGNSAQPWVYARSVLPERTLTGKSRYLRGLDNRPLGELLFSQPDIRRGPIVLNRLARNPHCQQPELSDSAPHAWGRRSTFWLQDKPLLVAETFLSGFNPHSSPMA